VSAHSKATFSAIMHATREMECECWKWRLWDPAILIILA